MTCATTVDPVEYLRGAWDVDRSVLDLRTGERGVFRGTARGEAVAAGVLHFVESGELTLSGHTGPGRRALELHRTVSGHADVQFADGRHFHGLELGPEPFVVEHRCGGDLYRGDYRLCGPARWSVVWEVDGPAKRYRLATSYVRLPGPLPDGVPHGVRGDGRALLVERR